MFAPRSGERKKSSNRSFAVCYVRPVEQAKDHRDSEARAGVPPNRIEALADGIFAVAMTILVLELHVPDLGPVASEAGLLAALRSLEPKIFSFGSGFVILGTLWIGHRFQFHYIRRSNRALLWINLAFLLTISFLPFVIALIGTYGPMRVSCVLYGATLVAALACLLVQWLYATGPGHLVGHPLPPEVYLGLRNRVLMGMVGYGGGLLLAPFAPRASLTCYAATPLLYLLPARFDRFIRDSG